MCMKTCVVFVELYVQAVSCPGVWLCPKGEVVLKLHMFGDTFSTAALNPDFPLHYGEKFTFRKVFKQMRHLTDLQQQLEKEVFYSELFQSNDGRGVKLATYQTNVSELLFPSPLNKALIAGVDVDLLMVSTKHFPGILGPKIEISTKTTIEEAVSSDSSSRKFGVINPKMLCSKMQSSKPSSRSTTCNRTYLPPSLRKCVCRTTTEHFSSEEREAKSDIASILRDHHTGKESDDNGNSALQHDECSCEICTTYHRYFGEMQASERQKCHHSKPLKVQDCMCHHYCCENYTQTRCIQPIRWVPESPSDGKNYREQFYNTLHNFYQKLYSGMRASK